MIGIVVDVGGAFQDAVLLHRQIHALLEKNSAAEEGSLGHDDVHPPEPAHLSMADWMALVLTVVPSARAPKSVIKTRFFGE